MHSDDHGKQPRDLGEADEHRALTESSSGRQDTTADTDGPKGMASVDEGASEQAASHDWLRDRHDLLTSVFKSAPFFVAITRGPEHIFEMANPAYRRLLGERDLVGRSVAEAIPEAEAQGLIRLLNRVFERGEPHTASEVPVLLEHVSGEPARHVLNFVYQPLFDDTGDVSGIHVHGTDVTDEVEARVKLEEKEARFRAVLESALDAAYRRDLVADRYDYMSPAIERLVGFTPQQMETMSTHEVLRRLHPADLDAVTAGIKRGMATGQSIVEYRFRSQEGHYRWLADHFTVQFDDEGRARYRTGVVRDITARKQAEEALRESEERYRTLFESMSEGFCVFEILFDDDGEPIDYRWLEINPAFERHTGLTDAVGKTVRELVPDLEEHWVRIYGRVAMTGEPEHFVRGSEAMGRWFEVDAFRVGEPQERKVGLLFTDITERKRAEVALRELNESLEQRIEKRTGQVRRLASQLTMAEQAERRRISQILHDDLQQQFYALGMKMRLAGQVLEEGHAGRGLELVREAEEWIDRGVEITRDLTVDLSPPILQSEGLADALQWIVAQMQVRHGLEVELKAEHTFRTPDEDMRVLLFQIVRELLFNVVKHAETDRATVELREAPAGRIQIRVTDEGKGFDVETAEVDGGGGFGLFSVRERLGLFGGSMEIESAPGEGTQVTISAPLQLVQGR